MSDLERELREVLAREGRNLDAPPPPAIPETVGARIRRRQMAMVLASVLLVAGFSVGGLSLIRTLSSAPSEQVDRPPVGPSPTTDSSPPRRGAVVATGVADGRAWTFRVQRDQDGSSWCVGVEVARLADAPSCGIEAPSFDPRESSFDLSLFTSGAKGFPWFLEGVVSKKVARIEVEVSGGNILRPEVLEPPPELGATFNLFVVVLPGDVVGEVRVFDGGGEQLQVAGFAPLGGGTRSVPSAEERRAIMSIVRFARDRSPQRFAEIPLADEVWLGLGAELRKRHPAAALADPAAWTVEARLFRAYVGPFSALEPLADPGPLRAVVGPHEHCASPPVLPPEEVAGLTRVSVQPRPGSIDTCLRWFTVDAFLDGDGRIVAVTLDLWEA